MVQYVQEIWAVSEKRLVWKYMFLNIMNFILKLIGTDMINL